MLVSSQSLSNRAVRVKRTSGNLGQVCRQLSGRNKDRSTSICQYVWLFKHRLIADFVTFRKIRTMIISVKWQSNLIVAGKKIRYFEFDACRRQNLDDDSYRISSIDRVSERDTNIPDEKNLDRNRIDLPDLWIADHVSGLHSLDGNCMDGTFIVCVRQKQTDVAVARWRCIDHRNQATWLHN